MANTHAPLLALTDIAKRYGRKSVLEGVSMALPESGLTLLVGPSGAGKSTLLRLVATAEKPSSGRIEYRGVALPKSRPALRGRLGYAPQIVDLPTDLTAREFAMHIAALKGLDLGGADRQFLMICERIGLHADANRRIAAFSGGMRRRLIFAQALLGDPALVALDEPTAELDSETASRVNALIRETAARCAVIATTHLADELAPHARQLLRVDSGGASPA